MLHREPQIASPIEDQILEAIISGSLPDSELPPSPFPPPPCTISPKALATHFHLPLSKVLDILADPRTRSRIAADQELRDLDFHRREQLARDKALTALENILDTTEDPIEKRRAATAILRRNSTRNPFWPRIPGGTATLRVASSFDDDLDEDTDETPPRDPLPNPEHAEWGRSPRQTVVRLLTRLQDNHNPSPNAGLTTLFLHKHDTKPGGNYNRDDIDDYLNNPGEEANLTNFSCAILHSPDPAGSGPDPNPNLPSAPSLHTERLTLHWPSHHRIVHFHLKATRAPGTALWKIDHIDIGPKDKSSPDSS